MIYYLNVCIIGGEFYGETMKNVSANDLLIMETLFNNILNKQHWIFILQREHVDIACENIQELNHI